jgi:hypothetical protein
MTTKGKESAAFEPWSVFVAAPGEMRRIQAAGALIGRYEGSSQGRLDREGVLASERIDL